MRSTLRIFTLILFTFLLIIYFPTCKFDNGIEPLPGTLGVDIIFLPWWIIQFVIRLAKRRDVSGQKLKKISISIGLQAFLIFAGAGLLFVYMGFSYPTPIKSSILFFTVAASFSVILISKIIQRLLFYWI